MPGYKNNIALIKDCPPLITLKAALETLGRPSDKDYGVLAVHDIMDGRLVFGIFRTKEVKTAQVEKSDGSVSHGIVKKDVLYEASVRVTEAGLGVLEVYSGSIKSIEVVGEFLKQLELAEEALEVEFIVQDVLGNLTKLREDDTIKSHRLMSAKLKGYPDATDDQVKGTFTVKFPKDLPPANALTFLNENAARVESVKVAFRREGMKKAATVTLRPSAYFTFNANESDETKALNVGRQLAGVPLR